MGTKLNRLTSPGRCVATGVDSPSRGPRPGTEVSVARDTAGRGGGCPRRPSPSGPRPRSRRSCAHPTSPPAPAEGGRPQQGSGAAWPPAAGEGPAQPGCDPRPARLSLPERGLCWPSPRLTAPVFRSSLVSHQAPTWAPALATRSRWPDGGVFTPLPSGRPGNLCLAWPPALGEETPGPAHATLLPSLFRSSTPVPSSGVCPVPFTSLPWLQSDQAASGWGAGRGAP